MMTGTGRNGTAGLAGGSQAYTLTNGIAQVAPVDVPAALQAGWTCHAGAAAAYAAARVRVMIPPATFVAPEGDLVALPDGNTASYASGSYPIPNAWAAFFESQGWTFANTLPGL